MPTYTDCLFFAERTSARRGADFAGTVLCIAKKLSPEMLNGSTVKAVGAPRGDATAIPVATWVSFAYLTRACVEVSEADARRIHPRLFAALEAYDRSPEYRASHAATLAEAIRRGAYDLQPADPAVIARLAPSKAEDVTDSRGWAHRR